MKSLELISVIVPVLNEVEFIERTLASLQPLRQAGHEIIVVDGGSNDDTLTRAQSLANQVLIAPRGRASQMNAGAAVARGDILWFFHADNLPPANVGQLILGALNNNGATWGRFDVRLSGSGILFRITEILMNIRSRLSGIATGDQGIFVKRGTFIKVGGYPDIALMEDIAISKRLRVFGRPVCLRQKMTTSSRRWERNGVWSTILLMWSLRLAYALGADPQKLARLYR